MSLLKADPKGLQALAKHCEGWSGEVAGAAAPSAPAASAQATAAAVNAVHAIAGSTGGVLATRMSANGGHLSTTAQQFAAHEEIGAQDLKSVATAS